MVSICKYNANDFIYTSGFQPFCDPVPPNLKVEISLLRPELYFLRSEKKWVTEEVAQNYVTLQSCVPCENSHVPQVGYR